MLKRQLDWQARSKVRPDVLGDSGKINFHAPSYDGSTIQTTSNDIQLSASKSDLEVVQTVRQVKAEDWQMQLEDVQRNVQVAALKIEATRAAGIESMRSCIKSKELKLVAAENRLNERQELVSRLDKRIADLESKINKLNESANDTSVEVNSFDVPY